MTRTLKPSTLIRNNMLSFVADNGLCDLDYTAIDGTHYHVLGATKWHYGQITLTHLELGTWIADYNKSDNLGTPKQVVQLPDGGWVGINHPLAKEYKLV